jgi:chromosome segregation ATPase
MTQPQQMEQMYQRLLTMEAAVQNLQHQVVHLTNDNAAIRQQVVHLTTDNETLRQQVVHLTTENAKFYEYHGELDVYLGELEKNVKQLESTPSGKTPRVSWTRHVKHQTQCAQCSKVLIKGKGVSQMGQSFCSSGCLARHRSYLNICD